MFLCVCIYFCVLQLLLSTAGTKQQLPQQVHRLLATHACKGTWELLPCYYYKLEHLVLKKVVLNQLSKAELLPHHHHNKPVITL